jgi:hypothetical protein
MPSPLQTDDTGLLLPVRLTPNASKDAVEGWRASDDGSRHLAVRVRAVPEKGKANKALVALLAKHLGLPKRDVDVIRGATSRLKTVRIEAKGPAQARIRSLLEGTSDER